MKDSDGIRRLVNEIEYLRAKRAQTDVIRPRLIVVHDHRRAVKNCLPGETIEQVALVVHMETIPLRLSASGLVIADVLVRMRPAALTARHIERILATNPFYIRLGANVASTTKQAVRPSRRTIKVYIDRLRQQIRRALKEAGITTPAENVLVSESTDLLNVKAYRLAIPCEVVHLDGNSEKR